MPRPRSRSRRRRRDKDVDRLPPARRDAEKSPPPAQRRHRKHRVPTAERDQSLSSAADDERNDKPDSRWVCARCGGPHRTKDCPMPDNPMSMQGMQGMNPVMMGMMGGPMGMMPMGMPGMLPMHGMSQMPPLSMMGMPAAPPTSGKAPLAEGAKKARKKGDKKARRKAEVSSDGFSSEEKCEPIEQVEKFIEDNRINDEAASKIRALSPSEQRRVVERPLTGDVQNPSKVMIARVREVQSQNEKQKAPSSTDYWSAWSGAMMGAPPEAIQKYIDDNDLDDSASRQLRSLPPHLQAQTLRWDLSSNRNRSAKFMSMASKLSKASQPMTGMPGMPGTHMQGMPFGWPMGMQPGMPQMGMHMPGMLPPPPSEPGALATLEPLVDSDF